MTKNQALVIEDDMANAKIVADLLASQDFTVFSAPSVGEARTRINSLDWLTLAVLDVHLPDGMGTSLIPVLQQKFADLKVIVMSSMNLHELDGLLQGLRIDTFILKPFEPARFIGEVQASFADPPDWAGQG